MTIPGTFILLVCISYKRPFFTVVSVSKALVGRTFSFIWRHTPFSGSIKHVPLSSSQTHRIGSSSNPQVILRVDTAINLVQRGNSSGLGSEDFSPPRDALICSEHFSPTLTERELSARKSEIQFHTEPSFPKGWIFCINSLLFAHSKATLKSKYHYNDPLIQSQSDLV